MVNAVREDDSSSARDNSFFIADICNTSSGLLKIVNSEGVSFFSRPEYFTGNGLERLKKEIGSCLTEDLVSLLLMRVRIYSAELMAVNYLGRAEHTRYQLALKLKKKGFFDEEIVRALDYLQIKRIIDDFRYANSWLHTRSLVKKEGRSRLLAELVKRGVSFSLANRALNDFFTENSELEICRKALNKQLDKGLEGHKLLRVMNRLGFPITLVNRCLEGKKNSID